MIVQTHTIHQGGQRLLVSVRDVVVAVCLGDLSGSRAWRGPGRIRDRQLGLTDTNSQCTHGCLHTHTDQRSLPVKSARVLPHPVSHQVHRYISTFVTFYQSFTMSYFTICRQRYANRREGNLRKKHDLFPGEHRERTATEKQTCLLTVSAAARSARTRHDVFAADRCRLVEANVSDGACAAKHSD